MSKKPETTNKPSHAIWQVSGEGNKARWTRIGSAWMHKDNKGSNLKFECLPLTGRVVLREITEQDNASESFNDAGQAGAK